MTAGIPLRNKTKEAMSRMHLRVPATPDAPRASRHSIRGLRDQLEPRYDDVLLVLSELVTNSVRHGPHGDVDVSIEAGPDAIRVEVSDGGSGFDPTAQREGMGLSIVERLSSEWGVVGGPGCTVWAELSRSL